MFAIQHIYSDQTSIHYSSNVSTILSKLNINSEIDIHLWDSNLNNWIGLNHNNYLIPLLTTLYHNHKLAFGVREGFDVNIALHSPDNSTLKVMDVVVRFEIEFVE